MMKNLTLILSALIAANAFAASGVNPQFIKWQKMKRAGLLPSQKKTEVMPAPSGARKVSSMSTLPTAEGDESVGLVPEMKDLSYLLDQQVGSSWKPSDGYPVKFDLRDEGAVTGVRNQGKFETCWAFAAFGSLESSILKLRDEEATYTASDIDFSERHVADYHGFDLSVKNGGNMLMAMAYLLRWDGPVSESVYAYPASDTSVWPDKETISESASAARLHVQNVRWLSPRVSALDNDTVKENVMNVGGVYVPYYANSAYFSAGYNTYFCPVSASANHGVTIIGWDDAKVCAGVPYPGAFLVKNSWGENWGDGGYFWVSYYDANFGRGSAMAVFHGAESKSNYATIYQHDELGYTGEEHAGGARNGKPWMANVFTAEKDDQIAAVGFYALTPGTAYSIKVYTGVDGAPSTGTLKDSNEQNGTVDYAGYVTVPLDKVVPVTAGTKFAVAVKLYSPGVSKPLALEKPIAGYSTRAGAAAGESWFSSNGERWTDLQSSVRGANFCVKAYGIADEDEDDHKDARLPTALEVDGPTVLAAGEMGTYTVKVVFDDGSKEDEWVELDSEIKSGSAALESSEAGGATFTMKIKDDLAEDTSVTVELSVYDSLSDRWVTKEITVVATKAVPQAPPDFAATEGTVVSGVRLTWSEVANAAEYKIYRGNTEEESRALFLATAVGDRYTDTTAEPGKSYYYSIKASNSSGQSAFSETKLGWRRLAAPENLVATDGDYDYVQLSWDGVEGAMVYRVYRASELDEEGNGVDLMAVSDWIDRTGYQDTPSEKGVDYYYFVKAALSGFGSGEGYRESDLSVFDPGSRKSLPYLASLEINGPSLVNAGSTGNIYTVTATLSDGFSIGAPAAEWRNSLTSAEFGPAAVEFAVDGFVNGDEYVASNTLFSITARYTFNNGEQSTTLEAVKYVTLAPVVPAAPNAVKIDETTTAGVKVSWTATAAATSYNLYRGTDPESAKLVAQTSETSFFDTKIAPGAELKYWVEAVNAAGASPKSGESEAALRAFLPPDSVSATFDDSITEVTVSWSEVIGAKYYRVSRAESADGEKHDISGWIVRREFADITADAGVTYWYFVEAAYDEAGGGKSAYSKATIGQRSAANTLAFIEISGPSTIQFDSDGQFTCYATYANGTYKRVQPAWSFKSSHAGVSVSSSGVVSAGHLEGDDFTLELQASYTDNGITKTDSFAVSFITWKEVVPSVFVSNLVVRARWPWNGKVDITYDLYSVPASTRATVTVSGKDYDLNADLQAVSLEGDGVEYPAAGGAPHQNCRVTWDLGRDYPDFHASKFTVSLDAAPYIVSYPANFRASDGTSTNAVELAWEESFGAEYYEIYRSLYNSTNEAERIAVVTNMTEFADSTATAGETYYYFIRTVAGEFESDVSEFSPAASGKRATPPVDTRVDLERGLVAYYKFDGNADDSFTNALHLTALDGTAPLVVEARSESAVNAYRFAGASSLSLSTNAAEKTAIAGSFTFAAWVKTDDTTALAAEQRAGFVAAANCLVAPEMNVEETSLGIAVSTKGVNVLEGSEGSLPASVRATADLSSGWHFVAFTVEDNGAPIVYIDGMYTKTGIDRGTAKKLYVGDNFGGGAYGRFTGSVDDAVYYDRALSADEIAALYQAGTPLSDRMEVASSPVIAVTEDGEYATVVVSASGEDENVYYTISRADGGNTVDSREYTVPFKVDGDATIIAWAVKANAYDSPRVRKEVKIAWKARAKSALGDGDGKIKWSSDGDSEWVFDSETTSDAGLGSMRSGAISANGTSTMTARFSGAGVFAFDWKVSSESEFDVLAVTVDGEYAHAISGEQDWSELIIYLTNDIEHVVSWIYSKDAQVDRGRDAGWVDYVVWAPEGSMVATPVITAEAIGEGASNRVTIATATPSALLSYRIDADGAEGEWSDYAESVEPFVIEGDATVYARAKKVGFIDSFLAKSDLRRSWIVRIRHALVLGADEATKNHVDFMADYYEYGVDEEYWWDEDRSVVSDGGFASARSAKCGDSESSSLFAKIDGAGTLFFDRKVDSEAGWDVLTYYAGEYYDDYSYGESVSGDIGFERVKVVFTTPYTHIVEWEYDKDASAKRGEDAGWIDNLKWVVARYAPAAPAERKGYTFGGYATEDGGEVVYGPGAMLDAEDTNENFIEVWKAHEYTLSYDAECADEHENVQYFRYGEAQKLYPKSYFVFQNGYAFEGWKIEGEGETLADEAEVVNLTDEDGATIVIEPVLSPINYTVTFETDGEKWADDISATYDVAFTLPEANEREGYLFRGWTLTEGGEMEYPANTSVSNLTASAGATVNLYGVWEMTEDPYGKAVDDPTRKMTSTTSAPWFVQTAVKYYGESALRSGAISDGGTSSIETVLENDSAKRVSFYWKVSSESNYDYLRFYVDGVETARICGEVDWTRYTVSLAAGSHTLRWSYTKDYSVSNGSDCGWLDYLTVRNVSAGGDDIWVDCENGSDEWGDGSRENPYATIQTGVDDAVAGATVHVMPGTYAAFKTSNRAITVVGEEGAAKTIVDGSIGKSSAWSTWVCCAELGSDAVCRGAPDSVTTSVIKGFTLQNGQIGVIGGTVYNSIIRGCYSGDDGGGALSSKLVNCLITGNYAADGAYAVSGGGCRSCTLYNCTVVGNSSPHHNGAGIGYSIAYNSIIAFNYDVDGTLDNCKSSSYYGCTLYNCLTDDPKFVDAANGDYRLAADSPAIDAGSNLNVLGDTDLNGNARILNGTVDLGAYEYGSGDGETVLGAGAFTVVQYTTNRRPYTMSDANSIIANPAYWSETPATNTYEKICFSDNEDQTYVPFYSSHVSFPGNVNGKKTWYATEATGYIVVPEAGEWTLCCGSDDGFSIEITGEGYSDSFQYYGDRNYGETLKTFTFPKAGVYKLRGAYFEYGTASTWILSVAKGRYTSVNTSNFKLLGTSESGITTCTPSPIPSWAE